MLCKRSLRESETVRAPSHWVRSHSGLVNTFSSGKAICSSALVLALGLGHGQPALFKPSSQGLPRGVRLVHCAALAKPSPTAISDHSSGEPGKMPPNPPERQGEQRARCSLPPLPYQHCKPWHLWERGWGLVRKGGVENQPTFFLSPPLYPLIPAHHRIKHANGEIGVLVDNLTSK